MNDLAALMCPEHPSELLSFCRCCRSEMLAGGNPEDMAERKSRLRAHECDGLFPPRFRNAHPEHPEILEWVRDFDGPDKPTESLLIAGPVGSGKTHQGYGALRAAVTGPCSTDFVATTAADLYAEVRHNAGGEAALRRYRNAGILLIDDLGAAKTSEWVEEITYRVLSDRYDHMRPIIATTNLPLGQLRDVLGARITSRLSQICRHVVLTGPDRRRLPTTGDHQ